MSVNVNVEDSQSGQVAKVTASRALAVSQPQPSKSYIATLGVDDTEVIIVSGEGSRRFCVTDIIVTGGRTISTTTNATVEIFTAVTSDITTPVTPLLTVSLAEATSIVLNGILLEGEAGHSIIGRTSDDDVFVTLLGFFI